MGLMRVNGYNTWQCDVCKRMAWQMIQSQEQVECTLTHQSLFGKIYLKTHWIPKTTVCYDCIIKKVVGQ